MAVDLLKRLESNLPAVQASPELAAVAPLANPEVQSDYEFSRKTYRELVANSNEAIKAMLELALSAEHPRAFEVLSVMLKNTSEITDKLMDLQKKKKDVTKTEGGNGTTTIPGQTNIFIGSTAELQKHLIKSALEKNVTDTAIP